MNPVQLKSDISDKIDQIADVYYVRGLREGMEVAMRIANWYGTNHKLKRPISDEELREWTNKAISSLRERIGETIRS